MQKILLRNNTKKDLFAGNQKRKQATSPVACFYLLVCWYIV